MRKSGWMLTFLGLALCHSFVLAQRPATLQEVAQRAIETSPEVQTRFHNFLAAQHEQDIARGGFRPRVDLSAGIANRQRDEAGISNLRFSQRSATLTLTQMLFDGFAVSNDVDRLGYAALTRYFEVLDIAENTALEAVRAYVDVLRYRDLVKLAEENYIRHHQYFDQIQQRAKAGVGRRVDLEQASGRLALAESNLLTEISNLHDVSARFQRVVGMVPADPLADTGLLQNDIPGHVSGALRRAYSSNPGLFAAIENIHAAEKEIAVRKARYSPRVDLRANTDRRNKNDLGVGPHANSRTIELVMNFNLYKGGSDSAAVRQAAEQMNSSKDLRDKACVDLRQTLTIAYNDIQRLSEQLKYLDQHQLSIEKAREAYQRQFEIGQRTLLDLLDTENEYFQARRAYVNGVRDHELAYARTQAGMGNLLASLKIARSNLPSLTDLSAQRPDGETMAGCAAEAPEALQLDKEALLAKATPMFKPQAAPAPTAVAETAAAPVAVVTPEAVAAPAQAQSGQAEKALNALVGNWLAAWMAKDLPKYFSFYDNDFKPAKGKGRNREQWMKTRKRIISNSYNINIKAEDIKVEQSKDNAKIEFRQTYRSDSFGDAVTKTLKVGQTDGQWLIKREETRDQVLNMPSGKAPAAAQIDASLSSRVNDWAAAWSARDLASYFSFYASDFEPAGKLSKADWEKRRTQIIGTQEDISVKIDNLKVLQQDKNSAVVTFQQSYASKAHRDTVQKTLELVQRDGKWQIRREIQGK